MKGTMPLKKENAFIKASPALLDTVLDKLGEPTAETFDLIAGLKGLKDGSISSITVGKTDSSKAYSKSETGDITAGELKIFLKSRKVVLGNSEINLTPKEFEILYFLAENRGEVFTKEQIYKAVWSDNYLFDDSNIMAFIRKLRKKIEPDPDAPKYILTIWGIGYKFNDMF